MKNIKKHPSNQKKKLLIVVLIAILLISIFVAIYALITHTSDSSNTINNPSTSEDSDNSSDNENSTPDTPTSTNTEDSYVSTPITQPSVQEPFPIENEHYKIVQNSETKYSVTLYPILNNPEYTDYQTQLKAYKKEVMDYLNKRFKDASKLSISWTPDEATNL